MVISESLSNFFAAAAGEAGGAGGAGAGVTTTAALVDTGIHLDVDEVYEGNHFIFHTAVPGDTLNSISRKYTPTTLCEIQVWNEMSTTKKKVPLTVGEEYIVKITDKKGNNIAVPRCHGEGQSKAKEEQKVDTKENKKEMYITALAKEFITTTDSNLRQQLWHTKVLQLSLEEQDLFTRLVQHQQEHPGAAATTATTAATATTPKLTQQGKEGDNWLCSNSCKYANDGSCDDGGPKAKYTACQRGTDCHDCGKRAILAQSRTSSTSSSSSTSSRTSRSIDISSTSSIPVTSNPLYHTQSQPKPPEVLELLPTPFNVDVNSEDATSSSNERWEADDRGNFQYVGDKEEDHTTAEHTFFPSSSSSSSSLGGGTEKSVKWRVDRDGYV